MLQCVCVCVLSDDEGEKDEAGRAKSQTQEKERDRDCADSHPNSRNPFRSGCTFFATQNLLTTTKKHFLPIVYMKLLAITGDGECFSSSSSQSKVNDYPGTLFFCRSSAE